ncbi:MAG: methylmalonyl Co-A mutase-associated GTPase MeaB [Bacteroidetes bacterium]|nr:methylmalonyl Co-A mutase-associated GTPase MeaB [Bacteroidota bacterium]
MNQSPKKPNETRPDWAPDQPDDAFAVRVVSGVDGGHDGLPASAPRDAAQASSKRRPDLSVEDHVKGVLANERTVLARTITLIESASPHHQQKARAVLEQLLPHAGRSIRVGVSGVPGAGKSTLIEALGMYLISQGHRVAVLAVDPSSTVTRGSILGDKTRMEQLSREPNAFIRPSPSGGTLGGVARKSRETITACEAAGYDVILMETVGVGQSEITVRSMVDFFMLVLIAGGGDELQGIKKGIIEITDAVVINKADGDNIQRAKLAVADYARALHWLKPATRGWETTAYRCSAVTGEGISDLWETILRFGKITRENGQFDERRRQQTVEWVRQMIADHLMDAFYHHEAVKSMLDEVDSQVQSGSLLPSAAVDRLLGAFRSGS